MGRFIEQNLPMKNFLFLLCILSLCFGCDKAYDLNKIESGDVTIGNDQSEWIMPLAQITVGMDELQDGSADIRAIFDEVDIWLPTTLPGNAEWVDIVRLSSDGTYLDGMLEALIDEMLVPGSKKMDEVVDLIWSNYEGENETYIEASAENSGSILYDKEIRDKPRTRRTKRNV